MYILFEEDSTFKSGSLLSETDTAMQVEMPSGKRSKIKAANVLLRFNQPSPTTLLEQAQTEAAAIEADFLWECVNEGEFSFLDFARDYVGHEPSAVEATAVLFALQSAPVYFHRKGRGRFRKAPADIVQAALAGLEKKRLQAVQLEQWTDALTNFSLPPEIAAISEALLYQPDRNRLETKAFEAACAATGLSAPQLLFRCGALKSAYDLHFRRFLREQFPKGTQFPEVAVPAAPTDLPRAEVQAFSIDDASTTEIDDALSVQALPGVGWKIGIHIAAPGLGFTPQTPVDAIARARLSTVYMPGQKITMLPDCVVQSFTLDGHSDCPAVSLYLTVNEALEVVSHESCLELVHIAANLRHHEIEPLFNAETLANNFAEVGEFRFREELVLLWQFANACEGRRGKPSSTQGINDYNFAIVGDLADPDACRVEISERKRGSPLDKLVAELMIVANSTWGGLLAEKHIACVYRAQTSGKVRMTTSPLPHEGLGVPQYAWCTSPLRRYVDLLNQWQLIACIRGETPLFAQRSVELFAAMRDFDLTYSAYANFQRQMERYWSLRWLQQENISEIAATVRREQLAKLDHLPLMLRIPSLPELAPGTRVSLSLANIDLLNLEVDCRYQATLAAATGASVPEEPEEFSELDSTTDATTAAPESPNSPNPTDPVTEVTTPEHHGNDTSTS